MAEMTVTTPIIIEQITVDCKNADTLRQAMLWNIEPQRLFDYLRKIADIDLSHPTFQKNKCYLWTGAVRDEIQKGSQHGVFKINENQNMHAHRIMYILVYGIPVDIVGMTEPCPCGAISSRTKQRKIYKSCCRPEVRHICKDITGCDFDGRCVNPLHMLIGTREENQHDIHRHDTDAGGVFPGETHPNTKLKNEIVVRIWEDMKAQKLTLKDIAKKFNVSSIEEKRGPLLREKILKGFMIKEMQGEFIFH